MTSSFRCVARTRRRRIKPYDTLRIDSPLVTPLHFGLQRWNACVFVCTPVDVCVSPRPCPCVREQGFWVRAEQPTESTRIQSTRERTRQLAHNIFAAFIAEAFAARKRRWRRMVRFLSLSAAIFLVVWCALNGCLTISFGTIADCSLNEPPQRTGRAIVRTSASRIYHTQQQKEKPRDTTHKKWNEVVKD